jgi:hypothetical protein
MKFIGILVEGQAEEEFVLSVLNPYLESKKLFLIVTVIKTKRSDEGSFKGGVSSYAKIEKDLRLLMQNSSTIATSTMFDLYGLPSDFPNREDKLAKSKKGVGLAEYLETKWLEQFPNQQHFIPYLAVHEFEALLFSEPKTITLNFPDLPNLASQELQKIYDEYENPEAINLDNPPAKRISSIIPKYRKLFNGIPIAEKIGISKMREECPHFDAWLKKLESLQNSP